jgi:DNA-binding MarR family transcriptional regulator
LIEGAEAPPVQAWLKMVRVFQGTEYELSCDLRRWGLSPAQFDVLAIVGANEGLAQQDLARWRMNTKGNVTRVLDRMRHKGLVSRRAEGKHKRLFLTEEGKKLLEEIAPHYLELIEECMSPLSLEEQIQLLDLLKKLDMERNNGRR